MDRQQLIGLFLIGLVIIGYGYWTRPTPEELAQDKARRDSIAQIQEASVNSESLEMELATVEESSSAHQEADSTRIARELAAAQSRFGIFHPASNGSEEDIRTVETETMIATVSSKGGYIRALQLKEFKTHDGAPLFLFDDRSEISIRLKTQNSDIIETKDLFFDPMDSDIQLTGEETKELRMRLRTDDPSKYIDHVYTFSASGYEVGFEVELNGLENNIDQDYGMLMNWHLEGLSTEKSPWFEDQICSVFYRYNGDDRDYLSEQGDDESDLDGQTNWVAFKQTFFSAVALSNDGFPKDEGFISITTPEEEIREKEGITKIYDADLTLPTIGSGNDRAGFTFYFGPNDYEIFKAYDNEMDKIINIGWGIFGLMNKWLVIPIFNFLEKYISSYGIIILILTIIIKMILVPLTYKNYLSSAKMKVLKPEIEELNKKFEKEDDPMKKQQAQMALYRKTGVNPMAGCLPMVIQMPILYAMFRFFPSSIELRQQSFLWADDLSSYDSIMSLPFEIPWYGTHVSLFTLLMAASTILYTRMNSANMPASQPGMPNMKTMMYIFPVMMLFFFNRYSSGLSYYYLTANLMSMGQMYFIKNVIIDEKKIRAEIEANKKKPVKKSGWQKRLEEAAKQQQKARKGQNKKKKR